MLQQLQDGHRHPAALQADALALALVRLRRLLLCARPRRREALHVRPGAFGLEGALEVGEVGVVRVVGAAGVGEAAESELDEGDAEGPGVRLDGVLCALYPLGL